MLEMSSKKYPNKIIFGDVKDEIKYAEFTKKEKIIGGFVMKNNNKLHRKSIKRFGQRYKIRLQKRNGLYFKSCNQNRKF